MTFEQSLIFMILGVTLGLFAFSNWRYDIVAFLSLLAVGLTGSIAPDKLFSGFGHPAVITVAAVLIISKGLQNSGLADFLSNLVEKIGTNQKLQLSLLLLIVAVFSGFMNDIGALAVVMPVAIKIARKGDRSPSSFLMPLAFASLLGGLLTMIGTPPNIIIATYRQNADSPPFQMFDFTPAGAGICLAGLAYLALIGSRFIPERKKAGAADAIYHMKEYTTEVHIPQNSEVVGQPLSYIESLANSSLTFIALERRGKKLLAPSLSETLLANDSLIIEGNPESMRNLVQAGNLELTESDNAVEKLSELDEVTIIEAIVSPWSDLIGKTAKELHLRWRYGIFLLAIGRHRERLIEGIRNVKLKAGDFLLLQAPPESMSETMSLIGCVPIAQKELKQVNSKRILLSIVIFGSAIALTIFNFLPVQTAFTAAALAMVLTKLLSLREAYESIEWPIIVLIGAMIPLGEVMESTGGAKLIGQTLIQITQGMQGWFTMASLLVITMCLANVMNHSAVAVLLAPVAISIATQIGASSDPFLMAVAIGCSSSFLTPIGHQSNALVMGPGGYAFSDYWRTGILLSILVILVAIPLIIKIWPLHAA